MLSFDLYASSVDLRAVTKVADINSAPRFARIVFTWRPRSTLGASVRTHVPALAVVRGHRAAHSATALSSPALAAISAVLTTGGILISLWHNATMHARTGGVRSRSSLG